MTSQARFYSEMVTVGAIIHGDRDKHLLFNTAEHPLALQLGGSKPSELAECARIAEDYGYDEINLNCGCPSDRVQEGRIGACLMAEPELVAECMSAMIDAVDVPVTIKHRIGIDDIDDPEHLSAFVETVAQSGCEVFIIHARKAWLKGLSPKQNREVPPLEYEKVLQIKKQFPDKTIIINGGITQLEQCNELLKGVDGVMIGREAYHNPFFLASVDESIYHGAPKLQTRDDILEQCIEYCQQQLSQGVKLHHVTRHILGLYMGQANGRKFRRYISENANKPNADESVLYNARQYMDS